MEKQRDDIEREVWEIYYKMDEQSRFLLFGEVLCLVPVDLLRQWHRGNEIAFKAEPTKEVKLEDR